MGKAEYIVLGSWAVQAKTGKIRHKLCRRWCNKYNEDGVKHHLCDAIDGEYSRSIDIPEMVITVSECLRRKVDASV